MRRKKISMVSHYFFFFFTILSLIYSIYSFMWFIIDITCSPFGLCLRLFESLPIYWAAQEAQCSKQNGIQLTLKLCGFGSWFASDCGHALREIPYGNWYCIISLKTICLSAVVMLSRSSFYLKKILLRHVIPFEPFRSVYQSLACIAKQPFIAAVP